jgi:DNA helicase-2/ATP-dependent DNA helicase PcrA
VPLERAVISGTIDLLLREDEQHNIVDATVIDFKAIEGGNDPENNTALHWTELALQVQLYASAAREVLGENARTGAVHLLKDNQRVVVPVDDAAVAAAIANVTWAVDRIVAGDFPMRPQAEKCASCDFAKLCPKIPEPFAEAGAPPEIHIPGGRQLALAFSQFDDGAAVDE